MNRDFSPPENNIEILSVAGNSCEHCEKNRENLGKRITAIMRFVIFIWLLIGLVVMWYMISF